MQEQNKLYVAVDISIIGIFQAKKQQNFLAKQTSLFKKRMWIPNIDLKYLKFVRLEII